jgi:acyl-CoA synthetase (AMP-forming)/AMP-acid ligase II
MSASRPAVAREARRAARSPWSSFVEVLRTRAREQPDDLAYEFLTGSEGQGTLSITYSELDRTARAIAAKLQASNAAQARVLLLYPPGLDFVAAFMGCLYAGAVAVTTYAPHPSRIRQALPGLQALIDDAACTLVMGSASLRAALTSLKGHGSTGSLSWLATDTLAEEWMDAWEEPPATPSTVALLQYTSGSTSQPRGVILTHGNLLHNSSLIYGGFENSPATRGVSWLPPYHDMGLIGGVLQPLYGGFPVTLMSPFAFLQQPYRWLRTISDKRATATGGPNFAYELCVRRITPEQRQQLDLSSWRLAFNGAEPIAAETMEAFSAAFEPAGFRREAFYPCYGLAEATLFVTGPLHEARPSVRAWDCDALAQNMATPATASLDTARHLVSCGRSSPDQNVVIANPDTHTACGPNQVGEVWIAGPSVAVGYWNRPDESARTFQAFLADSGEGPFLRTGDLGFLSDGHLFITGRLKDVIIVHARNHYPQDLELAAQSSHAALRAGAGAAFALDEGGTARLVVVHELERQFLNTDVQAVARSIRGAISEQHGLHVWAVALLRPGTLPRTSSGKVKRYACRADFLSGRLEVVGSSPC